MMWLQVNSVIDKITAKEGELLNKTMESQMAVWANGSSFCDGCY